MKRTLVLPLLALAAVAVASFAYAAIPSANGVISACVDTGGDLKLVDVESGAVCGKNKQLLTWNQQGPPGPAGPTGPQGAPGPSDAYYTSRTSLALFEGDESKTLVSLNLPAGSYLVHAKVTIDQGIKPFAQAACWLDIGGTTADVQSVVDDAGGGDAHLWHMRAITLTASSAVGLECGAYYTGALTNGAFISAIKVASLTNQS